MSEQQGAGRPKVITPEVVSILVASFHSGLTIREACWQSGISHEAYYSRLRTDDLFADTMAKAQGEVMISAKKLVADSIRTGNINSAKWWVDRYDKQKEDRTDEPEISSAVGQVLSPEEQLKIQKTIANIRVIESHRYIRKRNWEINEMAISETEKDQLRKELKDMATDELYELSLVRE